MSTRKPAMNPERLLLFSGVIWRMASITRQGNMKGIRRQKFLTSNLIEQTWRCPALVNRSLYSPTWQWNGVRQNNIQEIIQSFGREVFSRRPYQLDLSQPYLHLFLSLDIFIREHFEVEKNLLETFNVQNIFF